MKTISNNWQLVLNHLKLIQANSKNSIHNIRYKIYRLKIIRQSKSKNSRPRFLERSDRKSAMKIYYLNHLSLQRIKYPCEIFSKDKVNLKACFYLLTTKLSLLKLWRKKKWKYSLKKISCSSITIISPSIQILYSLEFWEYMKFKSQIKSPWYFSSQKTWSDMT